MITNILKGLLVGIPLTFLIMFVALNFTRTEGKNDCMQEYVGLCKQTGVCTGTIHRFNTGEYHIEHTSGMELTNKVGEANGCIHKADKLYVSVVNSAYCGVTYLLN